MISVRDRYYFGSRIADHGLNEIFKPALLLMLCVFSIGILSAQEIKIPQRPNPPRLVNDFAGMLAGGDADALEQKLVDYGTSTSTQIAVVTIPTLAGAEINQFATELFHEWQIGQKGKDNGVLLFIAKNDRKLFIITGRGVEEFLPDAICKRIIEETIKPEFKAGNYAQGINAGIDQMISRLSGNFKGDEQSEAKPVKFNLVWIIIIIVILFIVISSFFGGGNNGQNYSSSGSSGLWFLLGMLSGGGGRGGGWGSSGGGDSGGFGGFGGGDSGGGGAGGDW